jgi:Zn-dependent protease with chaperone function
MAIQPNSLVLSSLGHQDIVWPFKRLRAIGTPSDDQPLRLGLASAPGQRLTITDPAAVSQILRLAPHLRGDMKSNRLLRAAGIMGGGLIAVAVVIYLFVSLAPQKLAFVIPDEWRDQLGQAVERSFVSGARECSRPEGKTALAQLSIRLREGNPDLKRFDIRVYDIPVTNAFALPGDRIIILRGLLQRASAPEEVAGVLAHEIGHINYRHAEAHLIRTVGLQLLLSAATGGGSGDGLSSFAGLLAILSYSRSAEVEADGFALEVLTRAKIDPLGLRRFFETIAREEGEPLKGAFGRVGNMMSNHPLTQERVDAIRPAQGEVRPVMTDNEWQMLKSICS